MNKNYICTSSYGIKAPIIQEGDNIVEAVVESVCRATKFEDKEGYDIDDKDIITVTESVVARSLGLYATIDDIANDIRNKYGEKPTIALYNMIYSRNRFAMILRGIARGCKGGCLHLYMPKVDEVGNLNRNHPFTGMDYIQYYSDIVESEGTGCCIYETALPDASYKKYLYCGLHDFTEKKISFKGLGRGFYTLADILSDICDWGVLGSNKSTEEKIKLFPNIIDSIRICEGIKYEIKKRTGKDVLVAVYGDGCFHSPMINGLLGTSINEFADPVTMPGYTDEEVFESTPNEIKIKAFADDKYKNLDKADLDLAIKNEIKQKDKSLVGNMSSQGTTPRKIRDLVASLSDLTSGSGDKGTPIVLIKGYFNNFSD